MPEEINIVEEVTETEAKRKVDLNGAVGAATLVTGGLVLGKVGSWIYRKAKPKIQTFAGKVAGAGNTENTPASEESEQSVNAE